MKLQVKVNKYNAKNQSNTLITINKTLKKNKKIINETNIKNTVGSNRYDQQRIITNA